MRFHRSERVESLIQKELSVIIGRELEFDGAIVTIMGIDIDRKLEHAKVRVSVIPSEKAVAAMRVLERSAGELQHLLLKKINIKPMPRIVFSVDRGAENAAEVERLFLKEVPEENEGSE